MNRKKLLRPFLLLGAILAVILMTEMSVRSALADVQARISSSEAFVGSPVTLYVHVKDADADATPKCPAVDGLDVITVEPPSRSSQVTIVNGRRTECSSITHSYQVTPKREGAFEIPAIEVKTRSGVEKTRPVRFVATKSETGDLMFAEIIGNGGKSFVGQPIDSTLKIWIKPFVDRQAGIKLSADQMWQLVSEQSKWGGFQASIKKMAENGQQLRGREVLREDNKGVERSYYLYEIDATVYPKSAGKLTGQDVQVVYQYPVALGQSRDPFDSFFKDSPFGGMGGSSMASQFFGGRSPFGRSLTITGSRPIVVNPGVSNVEIAAIPTIGQPADYRGAVGQYGIATQASPMHVKAGDPITLQIGIRGTGPMELVQAPPLHQLPILATDFKVADDALAGVVQGDVKVFVTTIRPRNKDVTQIPAIPFSFFDPSSEQFVTVKSEPIQIRVDKAETLALDSIVGNGRAANDSDAKRVVSTATLRLENTDSASVLRSNASFDATQLWWLLLLPPMAWCAMSLWRFRRSFRSYEIVKTIRKIQNVDSPTALADIVQREISQYANKQVAHGRRSLSDHPADFQDDIEGFYAVCNQFAYVGADDRSLAELKKSAIDVVRRVGRLSQPFAFSHTIKSIWSKLKKYTKSPFRTVGYVSLSAIILLAVGSAFVRTEERTSKSTAAMNNWKNHTSRIRLNDSQRSTLLDEASEAYSGGQLLQTKDVAEAKLAFETASRKYQMLVDSGISNSALYSNLGNSYLQEGMLGKAIANYEKAIRLNPLNFDAANNLRLVNQRIPKTESNGTSLVTGLSITEAAKLAFQMIPIWSVWTLFGLGWMGLWSVLISRSCDLSCSARLNRFATTISIAAILVACSLISVEGRITELDDRPSAVFTDSIADVRVGCGDDFQPASGFNLNEGSKYQVVQKRGDWCQIETKSGTKGWIRLNSIEIVSNA